MMDDELWGICLRCRKETTTFTRIEHHHAEVHGRPHQVVAEIPIELSRCCGAEVEPLEEDDEAQDDES